VARPGPASHAFLAVCPSLGKKIGHPDWPCSADDDAAARRLGWCCCRGATLRPNDRAAGSYACRARPGGSRVAGSCGSTAPPPACDMATRAMRRPPARMAHHSGAPVALAPALAPPAPAVAPPPEPAPRAKLWLPRPRASPFRIFVLTKKRWQCNHCPCRLRWPGLDPHTLQASHEYRIISHARN
jgi:hypothetical protein